MPRLVAHRTSPWALGLGAAALVVLAGCDRGSRGEAPRPNVVLVLADDQDYEHLGFLGNPLAHTPTLDSLAEQGVVFPTAHVPVARCRPSQAALLSGRWPHQSGIYYNHGPRELDPEGSLPRRLRDAGYATYLGGKYWEGDPRAMGFERDAGYRPRDSRGAWAPLSFVRRDQSDLFAFIGENAGERPLFVWWAPVLPHPPHDPPERFLELVDAEAIPVPAGFTGDVAEYRRRERLSLAMVAWFDEGLGQLVEALRDAGEYEDTLFVFLIDNGWANGHVSKGSVFEKGVRTPLVFTWPAGLPGGERRPDLVSTLDVFPTILDLVGLPVPAQAAGRSLRARLVGGGDPAHEGPEARDVLYGAAYPQSATPLGQRGKTPEREVLALYARTRRWKVVLYLRDVRREHDELLGLQTILADYPERRRGDVDLFDLEADPYERHDVADDHRELVDELLAGALRWWRDTGGGALDLPPR